MKHDTELTHMGASKVSRYKWSDPGDMGRFSFIDKDRLVIPSDSYQRAAVSDTAERKIRKIASEFSWVAFQVLTVANRDGELFVMDGGHRLRAAMRRSDVSSVPCLVFNSEDEREEAKSYDAVNSSRKPMSAVDRHRAHLVAEDPLAIKVQGYIEAAGRHVSPKAGPNTVGCINDIKRMVQRDNEAFSRVWDITVNICEGKKIPQNILTGLFYLERWADTPPSNPRIRQKIMKAGYSRLKSAADEGAAFYGLRNQESFGMGMLNVINKGLHHKVSIKK